MVIVNEHDAEEARARKQRVYTKRREVSRDGGREGDRGGSHTEETTRVNETDMHDDGQTKGERDMDDKVLMMEAV